MHVESAQGGFSRRRRRSRLALEPVQAAVLGEDLLAEALHDRRRPSRPCDRPRVRRGPRRTVRRRTRRAAETPRSCPPTAGQSHRQHVRKLRACRRPASGRDRQCCRTAGIPGRPGRSTSLRALAMNRSNSSPISSADLDRHLLGEQVAPSRHPRRRRPARAQMWTEILVALLHLAVSGLGAVGDGTSCVHHAGHDLAGAAVGRQGALPRHGYAERAIYCGTWSATASTTLAASMSRPRRGPRRCLPAPTSTDCWGGRGRCGAVRGDAHGAGVRDARGDAVAVDRQATPAAPRQPHRRRRTSPTPHPAPARTAAGDGRSGGDLTSRTSSAGHV
ncbi:hypothetical protein SHIRM173S_05767 [Streptomyces hirsutus]